MTPSNDARWLAEHVLMPELKEIKKEQKTQGKCLTTIKIAQEKHSGRMEMIEGDVLRLQDDCDDHTKDKSVHFNPHYTESVPQRLWRKKSEIGVTLGGGSGIAGIVVLVAKIMGWID